MTNQVVINFLNQARKILLDDKSWVESTVQPINEAFDIAISALKAQDVPETNVGDTISRRTAIDELAKSMPRLYTADGSHPADEEIFKVQEAYADCIQTVKGLPLVKPAKEERWIPIAERLPEKGQKCLVSDKGCIVIDVFWGRGGAYNWQFYTRDYEAWMPLPDAYNTERRTDDVNADA